MGPESNEVNQKLGNVVLKLTSNDETCLSLPREIFTYSKIVFYTFLKGNSVLSPSCNTSIASTSCSDNPINILHYGCLGQVREHVFKMASYNLKVKQNKKISVKSGVFVRRHYHCAQ